MGYVEMFEFQGWITFRASYKDDDDRSETPIGAEGGGKLRRAIDSLKKEYEGSNVVHIYYDVLNGAVRFFVVGELNGRNPIWDEILNLYRLTSIEAPGSYGELTFFDEENDKDLDELYVLRKGKLEYFINPFLSPWFSKVEER
jgi:hypothetical protein